MLSSESSRSAHAIQNVQLLLLSLLSLPFTTALLIISYLVRPFYKSIPEQHRKHVRSTSTPYLETKTILVTGVGMTKGLSLARLFYAAGHNVIGADFEPSLLPTAAGRVSKSLKAFRKLQKPDGSIEGSARYAQSLLDVIRKEKVDLWVSCSGVASAVDDGKAKEMIELVTPCKAIQFDVEMTQTLHEKHSFIDFTDSIGLAVPETHNIISSEQALDILNKAQKSSKKFIMKYTGTDDSVRGDMTLLPFSSPAKTSSHIAKLHISPTRPWILQQFISGPEFCTHALVVNNTVRAFTACPSAELLMHYTALPPDSSLCKSMLRFTQEFAAACPPDFTGHLSFDFLVTTEDYLASKRGHARNVPLWPIECNPRAHTAVALFADTPEMVERGYMAVFDSTPPSPAVDHEGRRRLNGRKTQEPVYPVHPRKYYWLPHDLVELVILPVLSLVRVEGKSFLEVLESVSTFVDHVVYWKDGTFEVWDPLPAWWLWHVSWPWIFVSSIMTGSKWSRINVSTMKVFGC